MFKERAHQPGVRRDPRSGEALVPPPTPEYSATFIRYFTKAFWIFGRVWFRPSVDGLDRLPPAPCLLVGNHSGYGIMEIFVMLCIWTRRFAGARPVVGLSHDVGMRRLLRWGVVRIGGVKASASAAIEQLRRGYDVLVFPGGDEDALRPFSARYEVHWGNRFGFLRIAAETGVPIVPLATCGSHAQFTLLPGGRWIARALGLTRYRIKTWPVPLGSFALLGSLVGWWLGILSAWWILVGSLIAFFPNPTRIQLKFLPAIDGRHLLAMHSNEARAAAESVRRQIESELRAMAAKRRTAWS